MESPTATTESSAARPAPLIIRVPPPERLPYEGWTLVLVLIPIVAGALIGLYILVWEDRGARIVFPALLWSMTLLMVTLLVHENHRHQRDRMAFARSLAESPINPEEIRLSSLWRSPHFPPKQAAILQAARRFEPGLTRAQIICVGTIIMPTATDLRFEPEIIPTTRLISRWRLYFIPVGLAVLVLWALQRFGIVPTKLRIEPLSYPVIMGLSGILIWLWRAGIRPGYVRMAPGMIQVMRYTLGKDKPIIRSYPVDAGTTVIVSNAANRLKVTLIREKQEDTIPIWVMRRPKEQLERIWPALLSTAPTPPLSNEELLG